MAKQCTFFGKYLDSGNGSVDVVIHRIRDLLLNVTTMESATVKSSSGIKQAKEVIGECIREIESSTILKKHGEDVVVDAVNISNPSSLG